MNLNSKTLSLRSCWSLGISRRTYGFALLRPSVCPSVRASHHIWRSAHQILMIFCTKLHLVRLDGGSLIRSPQDYLHMCIALIGSASLCSKCLSLWTNLPSAYLPIYLPSMNHFLLLAGKRRKLS